MVMIMENVCHGKPAKTLHFKKGNVKCGTVILYEVRSPAIDTLQCCINMPRGMRN